MYVTKDSCYSMHTLRYCIVLYYVILLYIILYYIILYYDIVGLSDSGLLYELY